MSLSTLTVLAVLIGVAVCQVLPPPPTVDELNLLQYYGRWYNVSRNPLWNLNHSSEGK